MTNSLKSEKGGTLMLVFGFIVMLSIVVAPLAMSTNIGLLQAKTNANSEQSFTEAHSGMTVFARMYEDMKKVDNTENTVANIERLVQAVNDMDELDVQAVIVKNSSGKPIAVTFEAKHGVGNQVRSSKLNYKLEPVYVPTTPPTVVIPTPSPTPGPTPTPTVPAPGTGNKVLLKNSTTVQNNKLFAACYILPATGQALPLTHILNTFTDTQFQGWFGDTANYYLNQSAAAITNAFQNVFSDSRYSDVAALNSTVTSTEISKYQTGPAIINAGNVNISGSPSTVITSPVVINKDSNGNAVVANGNLYFKDIVKAPILFDGDVRVGGNLVFRQLDDNNTITFNHNVLVKGNVVIGEGTIDNLVIEGDLIVGGNLTVKNTFDNLIVKGDIIVAGDVNIDSTVLRWHVNGGMVVKGNMTATNGITSLDVKKSVTVKGNLKLTNPVSESREGVTGKFAIGGSLQVNGVLEIRNSVYGFTIEGNVIVNQDFTFFNVIEKNMKVKGSIYVKGNFSLNNTVHDFNVDGNVVVDGNFTAASTLERNFVIGGSLVTKGSIAFQNTIKSNVTMKIGENLISKTNLTFNPWTLYGSLDIGNMLLVFKDATFHNLDSDWKKNTMKGFYVGGTTSFNEQYAQSWYVNDLDSGGRQESICIK
ncbi:cytoskeletal protein CcmA (bactofilin family) [Paenibacillus endophyticus]|uniref:Cytoskeletal protein CcmA (Bactofilin family) n=1 Tax=Paenibacillus endophyticus TaxID=1294268 RepID=A0A7W5G9R3_9BACL|nr:hypothetical protein [Paenibacillus endophyticus]MBB3151227.1 cytoskeletal protein CcmA (bactofilin family) [Paenibacillus endophyticus]